MKYYHRTFHISHDGRSLGRRAVPIITSTGKLIEQLLGESSEQRNKLYETPHLTKSFMVNIFLDILDRKTNNTNGKLTKTEE